MTSLANAVGVQENGGSPVYIKRMAVSAINATGIERHKNVADVGGGRGDFSKELAGRCETVQLLDFSPPSAEVLPSNVRPLQCDLNGRWPLSDSQLDFAFAIEVIEHVENPRHFFRELARVVQPGGHAYVSTPNNHSLSSKLTFMLRGQHRYFQDFSYPAHITSLLHCDLKRLAVEAGFSIKEWFWSDHDTVPRVRMRIPGRGSLFSDSVGLLLGLKDAAN
jgi:2-polyprenyl-3-methyl-5-hydroxy-6-metoxy-1,4-benzoquinol methylase